MITILQNIYYKIIKIRSPFEKLFFSKEYEALTDKAGKNLYLIILILFLTFFAFSFSIGSLKYLNTKMNDPFTNWVNVSVNTDVYKQLYGINTYFSDDSVKTSFQLNNVSQYCEFYKIIYDNETQDAYNFKGRSIDYNSPLFEVILGKSELATKNNENKNDFDECGVVVSNVMLDDLNYSRSDPPKALKMYLDDGYGVYFLPIITSVDRLPNNSQFICSEPLYNYLMNPREYAYMINEDESNQLRIFSDLSETEIASIFGDRLRSIEPELDFTIDIDKQSFNPESTKKVYVFVFDEFLDSNRIRAEVIKVLEANKINGTKIFHRTECDNSLIDFDHRDFKRPHNLAFNFDQLTRIKDFNDALEKKFNISVNMSQVESKENFALVSKLTLFISIILFIFSLISIVIFINNMLNKHLQKIKMNLGTFKAFGVSNKSLYTIYLKIILSFILLSSLVAFVINAIVSFALNLFIGEPLFLFYSIFIFLIFIIILTIILINSRISVNSTLKHTPGDLIYNRK